MMTAGRKPPAVLTLADVPKDLAEYDQWGLWRRENGSKVPYSVTGRRASSTDPRGWAPLEQALETRRRQLNRWAGLAWFFSEDDPFVGTDLDTSLDEQGAVKPWARSIVERLADTYCETSPSGRGLKLWARGRLPANLGKVAVEDGGIELYDRARFFAFTGQVYRGAPLQIEDHTNDLLDLYEGLTANRRGWRWNPNRPTGRIPHGQQHFTLVSLAGTLHRRGVCEEAIEACLQTVNRLQCERPGRPENIARIARSMRRYTA